jgi:hypothetical protein
VQQSGGIAPGANIVVYQAPNSSQGFIDAFGAAIESNLADSRAAAECPTRACETEDGGSASQDDFQEKSFPKILSPKYISG